ncbi:hypothetical protein A6J33_018105 [Pantoea sp. FDAARGOS_194]|uniref:hypothetical protein n=1 Tax=Pantoea TaxID=53335 RepID=UPI000661167E|nr:MULTISPECIES: hypothetical protein [Pantoea]PNK64559.1 hypothetical protein A6J33_018105 [Pantoea sp. FDAARGOS_194]
MTTETKNHKRSLIIGGVLTLMTLICIAMTCLFVYVTNDANRQIESIREDYRKVADRRDAKVSKLAGQVEDLQKKLDAIPDRTATKTADKVKQVVKEDEDK